MLMATVGRGRKVSIGPFEYFVSVGDVLGDTQSDHAATDHPPPGRVVADAANKMTVWRERGGHLHRSPWCLGGPSRALAVRGTEVTCEQFDAAKLPLPSCVYRPPARLTQYP